MIKFEKTFLDLGRHSVVPVAFEFRGVSNFNVPVNVSSATSCGCTKATHPDTLEPGEEFVLVGSFIKTSKIEHRKTVSVTCKGEGIDSTQVLSFSVTLT